MQKKLAIQSPEEALLLKPENTPRDIRGLIRESELLKLYPVSSKTLYNQRVAGKIPWVRLPGCRNLLYHWPTVEAALLRHQHGAR
jgi:hypothetical protein